jgi:hypothetical protein
MQLLLVSRELKKTERIVRKQIFYVKHFAMRIRNEELSQETHQDSMIATFLKTVNVLNLVKSQCCKLQSSCSGWPGRASSGILKSILK